MEIRVTTGLVVTLLALAGCKSTESSSTQTQESPQRGAAIWRGFEQSWTYNHRLNRLGDYVTVECREAPKAELPRRRCRGEVVHTAASGTGADTAKFRSYHTRVASKHVGFQTGTAELYLDGREERDIRVEHEGRLPAGGRFRDRDHYAVVLNGFDVYAKGKQGKRAKAKKVQRFRIWSQGEAEYDSGSQTIEFELGAVLNMNCDSVECKQQLNRVRYKIQLHFLAIAYDDSVRKTTKPFETAYSWDKKNEIEKKTARLNRKRNQIKGVKEEFDAAVLGFREIDFQFGKKGKPKDHWFVEWSHALKDVEYDPTTGRATFNLNLFFKEWNRRAKKKWTSIARKGNAALRADVALLQFENATVEREQTEGTLRWKGKNRPAASPKAVWSEPFEMSF